MDAEKNISDQNDTPYTVSPLWQHYWQHLWLGAGIWVGIGFCFVAYWLINWPLTSSEDIGSLAAITFCFGIMFLILFTIPAALGGLLRQPALAWLSRHARSRGELIGGSLLLFEALVLLATLGGWFYLGITDSKNLWNSFLACFSISLPWLLATAWASWRLTAKLPALSELHPESRGLGSCTPQRKGSGC